MSDLPEARIGVIGGSGLYAMEGISNVQVVEAESLGIPSEFGNPSDDYAIGELDGTSVAFLPRHGRGHRLTPTEVPSRANIYGLKVLGVERIIGISSVGSLRGIIRPQDIVVPDQLIDLTTKRPSTFFGEGIVAHVQFAEPFCDDLRTHLITSAEETGVEVHTAGVYVCMEGPQFSTRAESERNRELRGTVIGMTASPEAKLAREAGICYGVLALVTDYDCWRVEEEAVSGSMVLENAAKNIIVAKKILPHVIPELEATATECNCATALESAVFTAPDMITAEARQRLAPILGQFVPEAPSSQG